MLYCCLKQHKLQEHFKRETLYNWYHMSFTVCNLDLCVCELFTLSSFCSFLICLFSAGRLSNFVVGVSDGNTVPSPGNYQVCAQHPGALGAGETKVRNIRKEFHEAGCFHLFICIGKTFSNCLNAPSYSLLT